MAQSAENCGLTRPPNIVVVLADDWGYGDLACQNPDSRIPTPFCDGLANQGMRFTDAHTGSAVCTPTRYGLLTGRYAWRSRLTRGVLWGYSAPLIDPEVPTLPAVLQRAGYRTAAIGKWHLGLEWARRVGSGPWPANIDTPDGYPTAHIDFTGPVLRGPHTAGYDRSFVLPASLDMAPYCFIRDGRIVTPPTDRCDDSPRPQYWRGGPISPGLTHASVMPRLTQEACEFLWDHHRTATDQPFMMAFYPTLPHYPHIPNLPYQGKSGCGAYGDGVVEFDASVGAILATLEATGHAENTIVIVTSDNGADLSGGQAGFGHASNSWLRGQKADIHEGGHRVPFIVRWPGVVDAGTVSDATICMTDIFATVADAVGATIPKGGAPDSVSFRSVLDGASAGTQVRGSVIHHSMDGTFAIRSGPWKLSTGLGTGGFTAPRTIEATPTGPTGTLFHLGDDPRETHDLWSEWPGEVARLRRELADIRGR